jgi:hypothetical protein
MIHGVGRDAARIVETLASRIVVTTPFRADKTSK